MSRIALRSLLIAAVACSCRVSFAQSEAAVVTERNQGEKATSDFRFENVPAPSATDAATTAKLSVVAGRRDGNGGQIRTLNDGKLPQHDDDPGKNFFFAAGSEGGRLVVDLGKPTLIKRVNVYSWHAGSRGPQSFDLYGDAPNEKEFDAKSAAEKNLAAAGWKRLAEVDSRPEGLDLGGQYGVSISGKKGGDLGTHRYLTFDVRATETDTPFGQTFFSEIDVDDGGEHQAPASAAPVVARIDDKYEITFDCSDAPELLPWVKETLQPICVEWYPKIVEMLPSEGYEAPEQFTIYFHSDMPGVAHAMGREIHCSAPWFAGNLKGEAAGAVVHEMVHIVQQYGRTRGGERNPGWLVEGLADYIRWHLYEPKEARRTPDPDRAEYTDSYQTTAAFLDFVVAEHDAKLIERFNAAMREGTYKESLWEEWTGKSVDALWAEYVRTLRR